MVRSLSSQKRLRQSLARAERNKARKTLIKTTIRKVADSLVARDVDAAEKALREASAVLDRSATQGTVHPNTAARRKSRLTKRLNALKAAGK